MERDGHPAAAAAFQSDRWAGAEDVIVLSAGRPAWQPPADGSAEPPTPEKLYYKTRLCDKYESTGRCTYEHGCSFAHGRAELRPPVPPAAGAWRRPDHEGARFGGGGGGRVCHNFRDRGSCHSGDKCAFPHASPPPGAPIRGAGEQKLVADPRRSATPPAARPNTAPRSAPGRAFPPVPAARDRLRQMGPDEEEGGSGGRKVSMLELLAGRKTSGIYGDWPEQYS